MLIDVPKNVAGVRENCYGCLGVRAVCTKGLELLGMDLEEKQKVNS